MPRSIWNGTLSFGVVHVPIKLYSATESKTVHFHEVHLEDGARIEHRRFCSKEDQEVPYEEVVKGYEVAADEYVVLNKDEIRPRRAAPAQVDRGRGLRLPARTSTRLLREDVLPRRGREAEDAYRLLHDALEQTGRAGIGRFLPQPRVPRRDPAARRRARAAHPALRRRARRRRRARLRGAAARCRGARGQDGRPLVESLHEDFGPRAKGRVPRGRAGADRAQGHGQGDRAAGRGGRGDAPDLLAALEASLDGGGR